MDRSLLCPQDHAAAFTAFLLLLFFPQTNILSDPSSPQKPPGLAYLISKQKISARMPICPFS